MDHHQEVEGIVIDVIIVIIIIPMDKMKTPNQVYPKKNNDVIMDDVALENI